MGPTLGQSAFGMKDVRGRGGSPLPHARCLEDRQDLACPNALAHPRQDL
jgi:hypothetical protein